jgi:hypothetical protein
MFEECKGDKFEFINRIKEMSAETYQRVQMRIPYEEKIVKIWEIGGSLDEEKDAWIEYINFEISNKMLKRAKLLYERGLISLDKDKHFRISYF